MFVDTNVLLYAQDPRAPDKQGRAQAWLRRCWQDGRGRLSTQVLNELYANLHRVAPALDRRLSRDLVVRYRAWRPWTVDETTVDIAWQLQDQHSVSYWDALMVAAAQQIGCTYLLTEDLQHAHRFEKVQVVNPFLVGPDLLDNAGVGV